tara:strand:- start:4003 stop:4728 length:726 start_codon:yes stop_codon:yes gene_type:complete
MEKEEKISASINAHPVINFATKPCWIFDILDEEQIKNINDPVIKLAYSEMNYEKLNKIKGIAGRSNVDGWHSKDDFHKYEELAPIKSLVSQMIENIVMDSRRDVKKPVPEATIYYDFWININHPGSRNAMHTHGTAHFSGCYYLKVPNGDCGALHLYTETVPSATILGGNDKYDQSRQLIPPKEGRFVFFRGNMHHEVEANKTQEDRISIGFNATLYNVEKTRYLNTDGKELNNSSIKSKI